MKGDADSSGCFCTGVDLVVDVLAGLAGEDLAGEDLSGEDLSEEDLAGEDLLGEDLAGEDLSGEDPAGEGLAGEDLSGNAQRWGHLPQTPDHWGRRIPHWSWILTRLL